jgi:hypothetical protein
VTDRRQVLKAGLSLFIASPIVSTRAAVAGMRIDTAPPLVICDLQYSASVTFGREAQQMGAVVRAIRSDITRLWRDQLIPLWRSGPAIQIGMTGYDALFCLSMVARDWGIRPVYRVHHRPQSNGTLLHEGIGHRIPPSLQRMQSTDWAKHTAELLLDRAKLPFDASNAAACRRAAEESAGVCRDSLVSWILAPIGPPIVTANS